MAYFSQILFVSRKLICMLVILIGGLDPTAVYRRNRLEWENAHIRWRLALWRGVLFTDESRFSLYRADGRQHVWRRVGERYADINVGDRVWLWYGQVYVMDNGHRSILLMAFWMHRDTVTRSWGPLLCHSSTTITSCCNMIMHGPMLQGSVHNSWKLKTSQSPPPYSKTAHFRVAFYCGQPKAHLCNDHAV